MSSPRLLALLVAALLPASVLAGLTTAVASVDPATRLAQPASDAKVRPAQDYPRMPRSCASPAEKIPARPLICHLNGFDRDRPTIVLWGDSHSWMFIPALERAAEGHHLNLVASMMGSCPPMDIRLGPDEEAPACLKSNDMGREYVMKLARGDQPLHVVLGASWQRYLHALRTHDRSDYVGKMAQYFRTATPRLFRTLADAGVGTDVLGEVATVPVQRAHCAKGEHPYSCNLPRHRALPEATSTRRWLHDKMRPLPGNAKPISVNNYFCNTSVCHGLVRGDHTWFDDFHISATMSRRLSKYLNRSVKGVDPSGGGGGGGTDNPPPPCPIPIIC